MKNNELSLFYQFMVLHNAIGHFGFMAMIASTSPFSPN
jgi:hypothetical protein